MPDSALPKKPARIAFFLLNFSGGGIERVNINLANELARQGYAIDIVVAHNSGEFAARVDPLVEVVNLGKSRAYQCLWPLLQYLRGVRPRVLFTCFPTLNLVAITAKLLAGGTTRIIPVEHMPVSVDRHENTNRLPRVCYALYPLFYRLVSEIVVNCEDSAADFRREFPSLATKVQVLYNPVVCPEILTLAAEALPADSFFDEAAGVPLLLGAGRLTRQKNFPLLLRAFALVRQARPCKLVICGGRGEDRETLQALSRALGVDNDVHFSGFVDNPFMYFKRASLFVLSSLYETLPTVLIEALACGTPAVATPCFGVGEILQHGAIGTIISDFKAGTLADAILHALDHPVAKLPCMIRAQEFAVAACAERYVRLIDKAL
jgi:glycosyltransferase involved in cell wall biosynthesis